jgi:hypothetical protein
LIGDSMPDRVDAPRKHRRLAPSERRESLIAAVARTRLE